MSKQELHGRQVPHYYQAQDKDRERDLKVGIGMRELAEKLCRETSEGTHRLLSHIIDVRREMLAERIATYRARGDDDVAEYATRKGDPLADALERALAVDG